MHKKAMSSILSILLLLSILTGCGSNKPKGTTKLSIDGTHLAEIATDDSGFYTVTGETNPNAHVNYKFDKSKQIRSGKTKASSKGHFSFLIKLGDKQKSSVVTIKVQAGSKKAYDDSILVTNYSTTYLKYASSISSKDRKASNKSTSISESKKSSVSKRHSIEESKTSSYLSKQSSRDKAANAVYSSTKPSYRSRYKRVSLDSFINDPEHYNGKDIKTTGNVSYIQHKPNDRTIDYVILNNGDYTLGTVTEVETEKLHTHHISVGDKVTIKGSGLTKTVKLNGKTLRSDIIVDSISQ